MNFNHYFRSTPYQYFSIVLQNNDLKNERKSRIPFKLKIIYLKNIYINIQIYTTK